MKILSSIALLTLLCSTTAFSIESAPPPLSPIASPQESRDALNIIRDSGFAQSTKITADQQKSLEQKIITILRKLSALEKKPREFLFPKQGITNHLKKISDKTFANAIEALDTIQENTVPSNPVDVRAVEERLMDQKEKTKKEAEKRQLDSDRDRVFDESKIQEKLHDPKQKEDIKTKIRDILEKFQNKTIPNLTGQNPIETLVGLLKPTTTFEQMNAALNGVGNDKGAQLFNKQAQKQESGVVNPSSVSHVTFNTIEDEVFIKAGPVKEAPPPGNPLTKTDEVQQLMSSPNSGFFSKEFPSNRNQSNVILKVFTIKGSTRGTGYYSFTMLSSNVKKLENLQKAKYEFWYIDGNFFAIPQDTTTLPVKSLSNYKSAFVGQVIANINKAITLR